MAVDPTLKLKIRAVYESNNLSPRKLKETRFSDVDVSHKTIESWVSKEGWKKNRCGDMTEAMDALIDATINEKMMDKAKQMVKSALGDDEKPEAYVEEVSSEMARRAITLGALQMKMGENLYRAEFFAKNAKSIGTVQTYHAMLTSTYQTIHGKQTNFKLLDPSEKEYSDEELERMSTEELRQLALSEIVDDET